MKSIKDYRDLLETACMREQDFLLKTLVNGIITLCLYISQLFPYEIFLVFKPALLPDQ